MIITASARWDPNSLRYELVSLTASSEDGITPADIRTISVPLVLGDVTSRGVLLAVGNQDSNETGLAPLMDVIELMFEKPADLAALVSNGPTDDALLWVAIFYSYGRAIGVEPNKLVVQILGLPQRTATRWIATAKKRGLIDTPREEKSDRG